MREISKIGPILSLIGGLWLLVVILIFSFIYPSLWYREYSIWFSYLPYQLITGIVAILGVMIRYKNIKVGSIILLITGIFFPIFALIFSGPLYMLYLLFNSIVIFNFLDIPFLILLIGGIVGFIEWLKEKRSLLNLKEVNNINSK